MAGDLRNQGEAEDSVRAYLSRLLATPVAVDQPIALRSVQRAALASWARMRGIPVRAALLGSSAPFSVRALLDPDQSAVATPRAAPVKVPAAQPPGGAHASVRGIGIDIEDIESLPRPDDYRAHPFFQDHFSATEIAYCVRQPDVAGSFCGTWAAKEAILKAGLAQDHAGELSKIAVDRDHLGRPSHPYCHLSISHSKHAAIAVCVAFYERTPTNFDHAGPEPSTMRSTGLRGRKPAVLAAALGLIACLAAWAAVVLHV